MWHTGSVALRQLDQGSNPCPLHWQADSYPLGHQESPNREINPLGLTGRCGYYLHVFGITYITTPWLTRCVFPWFIQKNNLKLQRSVRRGKRDGTDIFIHTGTSVILCQSPLPRDSQMRDCKKQGGLRHLKACLFHSHAEASL